MVAPEKTERIIPGTMTAALMLVTVTISMQKERSTTCIGIAPGDIPPEGIERTKTNQILVLNRLNRFTTQSITPTM